MPLWAVDYESLLSQIQPHSAVQVGEEDEDKELDLDNVEGNEYNIESEIEGKEDEYIDYDILL